MLFAQNITITFYDMPVYSITIQCVVGEKVDQRVAAHVEIMSIMKLSCGLKIIIFRTSLAPYATRQEQQGFLTRYKFRSAIVNMSF